MRLQTLYDRFCSWQQLVQLLNDNNSSIIRMKTIGKHGTENITLLLQVCYNWNSSTLFLTGSAMARASDHLYCNELDTLLCIYLGIECTAPCTTLLTSDTSAPGLHKCHALMWKYTILVVTHIQNKRVSEYQDMHACTKTNYLSWEADTKKLPVPAQAASKTWSWWPFKVAMQVQPVVS